MRSRSTATLSVSIEADGAYHREGGGPQREPTFFGAPDRIAARHRGKRQFPCRYPRGDRLVLSEGMALRDRCSTTGANVGAVITSLLVPAFVLMFDWLAAFFITGILSVLWLVA